MLWTENLSVVTPVKPIRVQSFTSSHLVISCLSHLVSILEEPPLGIFYHSISRPRFNLALVLEICDILRLCLPVQIMELARIVSRYYSRIDIVVNLHRSCRAVHCVGCSRLKVYRRSRGHR